MNHISLANVWKTVAAVVAGGIAWGNIVVQSAPAAVTAAEWMSGAALLAGAVGVYAAKNAGTAQG